jgi:hypothetical protein
MMQFVGWLLGFENVKSVEAVDLSLAAPWADGRAGQMVAACLAVVFVVVSFYRRLEDGRSRATQWTLIALRASLLVLLLLTLAAPLLSSSATVVHQPLVCVLVDDTASMATADLAARDGKRRAQRTRTERVHQLLSPANGAFIEQLEQIGGCRVETFVFSGDAASTVQTLNVNDLENSIQHNADRGARGTGQVTDLAAVLKNLPQYIDGDEVAAVVMFSDFVDNAAGSPIKREDAALDTIGFPIQTVGVGATEYGSVGLRSEDKVKSGEPTTVHVDLLQEGFVGREVRIKLEVRSLEGHDYEQWQLIGEQDIQFESAQQTADFSFTPPYTGRIEVQAEVVPLGNDPFFHSNLASRVIVAIDEPLRLLYVAYEPTWEWRFVKEVFQRDRLVGLQGFRTYLASADGRVRQTDDLFLTELTTERREFFASDVLFLGDVPSDLLTDEFCELVEEFVGKFGGGLVVMAGPRFGPRELAETPLADMLPVIVDAKSRLQDRREFPLQRTAESSLYRFMTLGETPDEDETAWSNLARIPWYQPVAAVHEQAHVLAEHPADLCADDKTKQPLMAIRPYGNGQVVYLGFNEMWRLRRKHGDRYYQRFWSQLIYRLGMSHAIGSEKRFVARFDRNTYRPSERGVLTLHAYDEDYRPLPLDVVRAETNADSVSRLGVEVDSSWFSFKEQAPGRFEASAEFKTTGGHTVGITDPVTGIRHKFRVVVADRSVEMERVARDGGLQQRIAEATGGRSYELSEMEQLLDDLKLAPVEVRENRQLALWNTPLWFLLVVGLMLSEWSLRRFVYLR